MNTVNVIFQILTLATPVIIIVLGKKLEGLRTKLIGLQTIITGVWAVVNASLLPSMCENLHMFCNIHNSTTWGIVTAVVGGVIMFIRQLQGGAAKLSELPQRLVFKKK